MTPKIACRLIAAATIALCAVVLAIPASAAEAASSSASVDGFFARVTWSERTGPYTNRVGYVFVSEVRPAGFREQPGFYLYYSIHESGAAPIIGYGMIATGVVQLDRGGVALDIDTSKIAGFTRLNGAGGRLQVSWRAQGQTVAEVDGLAVDSIGTVVRHERAGAWSEVVATASGTVLDVQISKQQTARMGVQSATASTVHFSLR